ncbi:MAG: LamG-like jellyroll fold domain-containing protein [Acidobacteriota bacterium]
MTQSDSRQLLPPTSTASRPSRLHASSGLLGLALLLLATLPARSATQLAYWSFDEGSGPTVADGTGNGNAGTLQGNTVFSTNSAFGSHALFMDGNGDEVLVTNQPSLDMSGLSAFTASAWFYRQGNGVGCCNPIVTQFALPGFGLRYDSRDTPSSQLEFWVATSDGLFGDANGQGTALPPANEWHHVVGVYTGSEIQLYLDGVLEFTLPITGTLGSVPQTRIGGASDGFWNGGLDEVRIFGDALSADEVAELYTSNTAPGSGSSGSGDCDLQPALDATDAVEAKLDANLDANVSSRASQASVDALEVKLDTLDVDFTPVLAGVDALEAKLDDSSAFTSDVELNAQTAVLQSSIDTRADQASVDALEAKLDVLEVKLDTEPSFTDDAELDAQTAAIEASIGTRADQASVDALEVKLDVLEVKLDEETSYTDDDELAAQTTALEASIDTRATQASVDAIEAKLDALEVDVDTDVEAIEAKLDASLDVAVSTRATQDSVDALEAKLDVLQVEVDGIEAELDTNLDTTVSSRADQASVDAIEAKLDDPTGFTSDAELSVAVDIVTAAVDTRATQDSVDAIEAKLDALEVDVDTDVEAIEAKLDTSLDASVSSRSTQESVDALEVKLDMLEAELPCQFFDLIFPQLPSYPILPAGHPCAGPSCDGLGFEGLTAGEVVNNQFSGLSISGTADVLAFDAADPTCLDEDLHAPAEGMVLILAEGDDGGCQPNDEDDGGIVTFAFDDPSHVVWVGVLDVEEDGGSITCHDDTGAVLLEVDIPRGADNEWQAIVLDLPGIAVIDVRLEGSGAITNVTCQ